MSRVTEKTVVLDDKQLTAMAKSLNVITGANGYNDFKQCELYSNEKLKPFKEVTLKYLEEVDDIIAQTTRGKPQAIEEIRAAEYLFLIKSHSYDRAPSRSQSSACSEYWEREHAFFQRCEDNLKKVNGIKTWTVHPKRHDCHHIILVSNLASCVLSLLLFIQQNKELSSEVTVLKELLLGSLQLKESDDSIVDVKTVSDGKSSEVGISSSGSVPGMGFVAAIGGVSAGAASQAWGLDSDSDIEETGKQRLL